MKTSKPTATTLSFVPVPAFPHPGGKTRLLRHILPHIPEHRAYVELFCGAFAVLRAKARSKIEVINDLNNELITFLRYAQFHRDLLLTELSRWPGSSRANFAALLANPGITDLQRAVRWYLLRICSFGGKDAAFGRDREAYRGYSAETHEKRITQLSERLQRVTIESVDWEECAKFYDAHDAFFFLDPPYINCADVGYTPFMPADMQRVRDFLGRAKGRWILTCDDSPACREIFAGLPVLPMSIRYFFGKNSSKDASGELLVMHPALAPADAEVLPFASGQGSLPFRKSTRRRAA